MSTASSPELRSHERVAPACADPPPLRYRGRGPSRPLIATPLLNDNNMLVPKHGGCNRGAAKKQRLIRKMINRLVKQLLAPDRNYARPAFPQHRGLDAINQGRTREITIGWWELLRQRWFHFRTKRGSFHLARLPCSRFRLKRVVVDKQDASRQPKHPATTMVAERRRSSIRKTDAHMAAKCWANCG